MSGRRTLEWLRQGDRIYLLATLGLAALLGAMAIGPVKSYTAAADRVDQLYSSRAELEAKVDRLEERRLQLENPEEIELLAREHLGLVRPGEIPYIIVAPPSGASPGSPLGYPASSPSSGMPPQAPSPPVGSASAAPAPQPWHQRLGQALRGLRG